MNYIYDLVLNFFEVKDDFEFYEWNREDVLFYIKKIPIFKVNSLQMEEMMKYQVKFDEDFLKKIKNKTLLEKEVIPYSFLITDMSRVYAFKLGDDGVVQEKSSLLFDEEDAVMEESFDFDLEVLSYELVEKYSISHTFLTRKEKDIQQYLLQELDSLYQNKNYDEIDYLYYELFSDNRNTHNKYKYLIHKITNNFSDKYNKLYEVINLTKEEKKIA